MRILARSYATQQLVSIETGGGLIRSLDAEPESAAATDLPWIAPGLVDVQVNGFRGIAFNSPSLTTDEVITLTASLAAQGLTAYCPTLTTDSFENLARAMRIIAQVADGAEEVRGRVAGIHLEGPYICPEDGPRGAHPLCFVRPPDWEEFQRWQEAAGGRIRILTLSPEYEGAADFIARVAASGVVVAIGHTRADGQQIRRAVDAGARLSTHLGNAAHGQIRRHPNYIWDQLAEDRLSASLIADGRHLPPAVVKVFVRAKSPERCILISDLTSLAGLPPGRYDAPSLGQVDVLEDGRLAIAGQRQLLAGAALPMAAGIANVLRYTGCGLRAAVDMAASGPAALLGLPPARLEIGAPADLMLFRLPGALGDQPLGDLEVVATVKSGELIWGRLPQQSAA